MDENTPGNYDEECEELLKRLNAKAVVLMVLGGDRGEGFSASTVNVNVIPLLPELLHTVADEIGRGQPKPGLGIDLRGPRQ